MEYWEESLVACIFYIFCILIVYGILKPKKDRRQTLLWCAAVCLLLMAATAGYQLVSGQLSAFVGNYEAVRGGDITQVGNILLTIDAFIKNMLPGVAVLAAAFWQYKGNREEKFFIVMLILLVESIILNVVCEITNLPFSNGITDRVRDYPLLPVRLLIMVFWMSISVFVFQYFLRKRILDMLEQIRGQVSTVIKLPAASYIVFCLVLIVVNMLNANFRSIDKANIYVAVVVVGGMIAMYILMYSALFQAVHASSRIASVEADLKVASDIQRSALPAVFPAFPEQKGFDIFASMRPAKEVGGDFYDFFMIGDDQLAFVIADVAGKGVPAALFMMAGKTTIRNQAALRNEPGEVLCYSNEQLLENNEQGLFITAFLAILSLKTGELRFANAGHNPPLILKADGSMEFLKMRRGFVLGGMEGIRYQTESILLKPGEKILLYTDGVTEACNMQMELYGNTRLFHAVSQKMTQPVKDIVEGINRDVDQYAKGMMQADDITMLMVEYRGADQ